MIPFSLLADMVLIAHLSFIVFAMFGGLSTLRWACAPFVHLPALGWAVHIEFSSGVCPLTPLENSLRQAAGESSYSSSFIEHYLVPLIYPQGLSTGTQVWLAAGLLLLNGLVYRYVSVRRRARHRSGRPSR